MAFLCTAARSVINPPHETIIFFRFVLFECVLHVHTHTHTLIVRDRTYLTVTFLTEDVYTLVKNWNETAKWNVYVKSSTGYCSRIDRVQRIFAVCQSQFSKTSVWYWLVASVTEKCTLNQLKSLKKYIKIYMHFFVSEHGCKYLILLICNKSNIVFFHLCLRYGKN